MSGAQLARRMGVGRANVAQAERNEANGTVTLKTLQAMALAMDGRVVYTIVPNTPNANVSDLLRRQAERKAIQLVSTASTHMALENQSLDAAGEKFEIQRLTDELLAEMPRDFWDEDE